MKLAVGLALIVLGSCSSAQTFVMPDGRTGHIIACSGSLGSWPACYEAARKTCSGNYGVVRQNEYAQGHLAVRELEFTCGG